MENLVYQEIAKTYPKSIRYMQEENFWDLNTELIEVMNKSGFFIRRKQTKLFGDMQQLLGHLARKLIEDGYKLQPGTYELWFEMLSKKSEEITGSSPNMEFIFMVLEYMRESAKNKQAKAIMDNLFK